MTRLLFVYGTLRAGCRNDIARIQPRAVFAEAAQVRGRLYDLGWYPALLLEPAAHWVDGELYEVPDDAWAPLDALEEPVTDTRPDGEYFKHVVEVRTPSGPRQAWIYSANARALKLTVPIEETDWIAYAKRVGKQP